MRVAVLSNGVPFQRGGAEHLADSLVTALREHGHQAELFRTLLRSDTPRQVQESMMSARLWRLANVERVIALKFPAYLVPHPDKVLWLLHQFRQAYDLWSPALAARPDWVELREQVRTADATALSEVRASYCIGEPVQQRLERFNGHHAELLFHPLGDTSMLRNDGYGDYLLVLGRINDHKRQHLCLEALAHATSDVRLVIAGPPQSDADVRRLRALADRHGLGARVEILAEFLDERRKHDLIAGALGVVYAPVDEDSYGYVTLEAQLSGKAVVTTTDAGGVLTLVRDDDTGVVVEPTPAALAAAYDALRADPAKARALGERARDAVTALDISWERVVTALTADTSAPETHQEASA